MTEIDQRPLAAGEWLDVFRIERVLGVGGFGITYLATDTSLNCQVAIKEYFPQNAWRDQSSRSVLSHQGNSSQGFQIGLDRFHKEGQALALFNHPNIVRVRRLMAANGTAYLVMDYERGETLESYLQRLGRPLTYPEAEAIFNPLLDGLRAVHERGLLHLDIKPANIFLRSDEVPVLIDFGGARHQLGQASRMVSFLVASDGYAPAEQYSCNGQQLQPTTDIYAIGATLYHCITGKIPADSQNRANAVIDVRPDPLVPVSHMVKAGAYPTPFLQCLETALSMRAASRPQTVRELQQRLFQTAPSPVPSPQPTPSPSPRSWAPLLVTAGVVLTLILGSYLLSTQNQTGELQKRKEEAEREIRQNREEAEAAARETQRQAGESKRQAEEATQRAREAQRQAEEAVGETRRQAEESKRQAEEATQRAREAQGQAEEAAREAQRQVEEAKKAPRLPPPPPVNRSEIELDKLASAIAEYYAAIASADANAVRSLWKDPSSSKAQKAYDNVRRGGGGSCKLTGQGSHEFNGPFTQAVVYITVTCDERKQGSGMRDYTLLISFEKNSSDDWRITDLRSAR